MKILRNLFAIFALFGFLVTSQAYAAEISDVSENYWANPGIIDMVSKNVM